MTSERTCKRLGWHAPSCYQDLYVVEALRPYHDVKVGEVIIDRARLVHATAGELRRLIRDDRGWTPRIRVLRRVVLHGRHDHDTDETALWGEA